MIELLECLSGTDAQGNSFACKVGETVSLDQKSEENLVKLGMAKKAVQKKEKKK